MKINEIILETEFGVEPKRPRRQGSRPDRGHELTSGYKNIDQDLAERGKASVKLCTSSKPDKDLGASQLASCKSQGLRARDGDKSHKLGKTKKSRVKVGGKRIKGAKYGGPLKDYSESVESKKS